MKKYTVQIMDEALEDMFEIRNYIRDNLKEPKIADEHINIFLDEISNLKDTANIYELLDKDIVGEDNIRKIIVKNYIIFYNINEEKNLVQVIAVFYGMSNWQSRIKKRVKD